MKNFRRVLTLAALSCAFAAPAAARADVLSDNTADLHVSSLGYGVAVGRSIAPRVDLRLSSGTLSYDRAVSSDNIDFNGSIRLHNVAALLDLHPMNSAFRLTGGLVFGNDRIDVTGVPHSGTSYLINGHTYSASQAGNVVGSAKLGSAAPYLGIGTGAPHRLGAYFTADAGVVLRSVTTSLDATGPAASDPQFQADLAQARKDFANSVNFLKTYPVVSVGIATRF
ncbi:MAG: hypothetical protein JWM87_1228 [Candidatus Eremiobacteraeota bacterium]|nr:hypothetical protein [Candidatus Eremiobacteraeota bacterium]